MGELRNAHKILVLRHTRKVVHGRPCHKWQDNLKKSRNRVEFNRLKTGYNGERSYEHFGFTETIN